MHDAQDTVKLHATLQTRRSQQACISAYGAGGGAPLDNWALRLSEALLLVTPGCVRLIHGAALCADVILKRDVADLHCTGVVLAKRLKLRLVASHCPSARCCSAHVAWAC
jgi:hypothetical protein